MTSNVLLACMLGFFTGRMLLKAEGEKLLLLAVSSLSLYILLFFMVRMDMGARRAKITVGIALSAMTLTIGVIMISRKITWVYHNDPVFHAKVNAYVFGDPRWQAQLDPNWFAKRRALIDRRTDRLRRMRFGCNSNLTEEARMYNIEINDYNRALVGSMVGSQYAEPVRELLILQFNDQLAPCGEVFRPL